MLGNPELERALLEQTYDGVMTVTGTRKQEVNGETVVTPDAVLHDPAEIAARCVAMAAGEPIRDVEGGELVLTPGSICVHGDTPGAVEIARQVRAALTAAGVALTPFATA